LYRGLQVVREVTCPKSQRAGFQLAALDDSPSVTRKSPGRPNVRQCARRSSMSAPGFGIVAALPLVLVRAGRCSRKANSSNDPSASHPPSPANQPKRKSPKITPSTGLDNISKNRTTTSYTTPVDLTRRPRTPSDPARKRTLDLPLKTDQTADRMRPLCRNQPKRRHPRHLMTPPWPGSSPVQRGRI
jgi:hypothetical protein